MRETESIVAIHKILFKREAIVALEPKKLSFARFFDMGAHLGLKPYSKEAADALRLLVRYILSAHSVGTQSAAVAEEGWSRTSFNRFMSGASSTASEAEWFTRAGAWASRCCDEILPLPQFTKSVTSAVFTDERVDELFDPANPLLDENVSPERPFGVISDPLVIKHRSEYESDHHDLRYDKSGLYQLMGLSLLVRPSNELARKDGKRVPGTSISLLNIVPEFIETGDHHPVFKLRQRGAQGSINDIEGVVLCQDDRLNLRGREQGQKRIFSASVLFNRDQARAFRPDAGDDPAEALLGVMLGVSTSKANFGSYFKLFSVPGGRLSEDQIQDPDARDQFDTLYRTLGKVAGVHPTDDIVEILSDAGTNNAADDIKQLYEIATTDVVFTAI